MITFKNIAGNKFLAVGTIQRKSALNGERSLTGVLYDGEDVLNKIDKGWSLEFDNEPYVVTYFERNDNDNSVSFDAIHKFFWDMNKSVLYSETSGSHTIKWYLDTLFADTRYSYALNFNPNAIQKENWGMKNKLSLFNDIISSIEGEFEINGTLISIFKNIGTDLSTIVRYGFNLSDMTLENDANSFVTYGEGFGEYADPENMTGDRLHVTYTSPLASVYGKLQAEPIDNRNYTISENLLAAVKKQVDDSFSVSVKLSLYDLSVAGYPYKMANVGDWLTAVDENLDFKQRIRIISIDDEFAADGTRISYTVTAGDVGVTKKYQDANASLVSKVEEAVVSSGQAITDANIALIAANGKNKSYYLNSVDDLPLTANEGDLAWVQSGDGRVLYIYTKKSDGSYYWKKRIDPEMGEQIVAGVNDAIAQAKENTATAIEENNTQINETINQVAKSQADLAIKDGDFNNKAQAMADKALSDAKANTATVAQETLDTANENIATAKTSLSGDIVKEVSDRKAAITAADTKAKGYADAAKQSVTESLNQEVSDRNAAVSALDTKAQGYADSAKQDAINAATTADGTINKKIDDTATSLTSKITQNKQDTDGKITTAQSTATQALNEVKTKVSQTEYNTKTGQLTTDVNSVTQTANQSKQDIVSINQKDGQQDSRMNSIESDASGTKQTISDIQKNDGQQDSKIATITSDVSGLNAKWVQAQSDINDLGQTNQLFNTEFNPDFEGWVPNGMSPEIYGVIDGSNVLKLTTANNNNWNNFRQQITNIRPNGILSASIFVGDNTGTGTFTVDSYDSSGKRTVVAQKAISSQSTKLILEGITIPTDSVSVFVGVWSNENGEILTISQPMVVFNPTVGKYVQGNYSNNGKVATLSAGVDGLNGQFSQYKTTNDGKVSKAQSDILANTSSIATKVSQTDYDKKTGDLTTSVNSVTQTANQSKQDIISINQKDSSQDSRMNTIESDANGTKQTISNIQTVQSDQSGSITTLQSRADGVDVSVANIKNQVNSLGQTNQLINTEFNPDFASWGAANTGGFIPALGTPVNGSNSTKLVHSATTSWQSYRQKIISAVPGTVLSASIFISESDGTNWSLAIDSYNASGTRTIIRAVSLTKSGLFTLQNLVVPDDSKSVYFSLWAQQANAKLTFSKPMFVFNNTVGDYVQGSYSDIEGISKAQLTADQATLSIQNYKADADGRITKAQSDITQTANQVATKVSQTDYDTKTGDLTTKVSKAQQTADSATTTIGSYKTSNDNRVAAAETKISQNTDAINLRATKTDLDSAKNDYTAKISQVNIDINGIESSVSDIQGEVSSQQITIDGITSTVTQQGKDINSVTSRVQTAEGNISIATNNISGMQTKITQTSNQIAQEITDRTTGDSNTLQSAKNFTQSTITSYDSGLQSQLTQTNDAFLATVSANNLIVDSSLTDSATTNSIVNWTPSGQKKWYYSSGVAYKGVQSMGYNQTGLDGDYSFLDSLVWSNFSFTGTTLNVSVDVKANTIGSTGTDYLIVYLIEADADMKTVAQTSITGTLGDSNSSWTNYRKRITVNSASKNFYLRYQMRGNGNVYVARPYVGVQELVEGGYTAGTNNNNQTILSLFKDNWSIGISDNIGAITSGIVGNASQMSLINKNITLDGNTTVTGDFYALGGNFTNLNASNITVGTLNGNQVNVTNINVASLTGDVSSFIRSNWNSIYSTAVIDSTELKFLASTGAETKLSVGNLNFKMKNTASGGIENMGGVSVSYNPDGQNQNGVFLKLNLYHSSNPGDSHYDGTGSDFWAGDEMGMGVTGDANGTLRPKMKWSSQGAASNLGITPGFNFMDNVNLNSNIINVNGAQSGLQIGWVSWSDIPNQKLPAIRSASSTALGGAGVAFGWSKLFMFDTDARRSVVDI